MLKIGRIMGVACLEFRGENFRGWRKNREIRESFLPRKFPAIRYCSKPHQFIYIISMTLIASVREIRKFLVL